MMVSGYPPLKGEEPMPLPKFKVGDVVAFIPAVGRFYYAPDGVYEVTKVLPDHNGEREYRVKNANEPHERVARESELEPA